MRSSKMATGSGRAAIFLRLRNRGRKTRPRSWMTSFPPQPSWIQDGDGGNDVWRTSRRPWRRSTDVCPIHESCRSLNFFRFKKHLIISLTQALSKWLSELPACHYGEVDQSARANTMKHGVDFGKHLLYFFFFFFFFFNCTLQQPRIVVQYSVIVGRNLETNLTPTMTIFWFSSILSTKRPWRSSSRMSCICTIRMLPNLPRSRIAPWLPLRRQNPEQTRSKATMGRWLYPWSIEGL